MNKLLYAISILALAATMTSCEEDNSVVKTFTLSQTNAVTGPDNSTSFYSASYVYEIDYSDGKIDIKANGVKFSPMMPAINMEIDDVPFSYTESGGLKINASNLIPEVADQKMPEYTITSLSGRIESSVIAEGLTAMLTYTINTAYTVNSYPSPMIFEHESETIVTNSYNSESFTSKESSLIVYLDIDARTADIYIHKAKFADMMPAMNMAFKDIPLTATASGFELACDSLTPFIVGDTGSETPAPNYGISGLEAVMRDGTFAVKFTCSITADGNSAAGMSYNVMTGAFLLPQD